MIVLTVAFVENLSACPPDKVIYKRAPDKGLWWFWHSEVWPRCEVEVSYCAHLRQNFHNCVDSTKMGKIAHEFAIKPFSHSSNAILHHHYHHHRHENRKRYRVTAHHAEFIDVPIREVGLVQDCNLQGGCHQD